MCGSNKYQTHIRPTLIAGRFINHRNMLIYCWGIIERVLIVFCVGVATLSVQSRSIYVLCIEFYIFYLFQNSMTAVVVATIFIVYVEHIHIWCWDIFGLCCLFVICEIAFYMFSLTVPRSRRILHIICDSLIHLPNTTHQKRIQLLCHLLANPSV